MKHAVKPAHFKATWNDSTGITTHYACMAHEVKLREHAEDRATVQDVGPEERDSAAVWCGYCSQERT